MKNFLIAFVALFCFGKAVYAQTTLGVKAGAGLANIVIKDVPEHLNSDIHDTRASYLGGVTLHHALSGKLGVATELLYELKGTRIKVENDPAGNALNLHYLSLPVLAYYELIPRLRIEFGPQVGYRFAASFERMERNAPFTAKDIYDQEWDIGLSGGLRFYVLKQVSFTARYVHGFSSVTSVRYSDENGEPGARVKQQNRNLQFSLGYEFSMSKP